MNESIQPFEHVCGIVDVGRFLDYCASTDFSERVPGNIVEIRADYAHLNECNPCTAALRTVLAEHQKINPRFAAQTVARNMEYLSSTRE